MPEKGSFRTILILWLSWGLLVIGFQKVVAARLDLRVPDTVLDWTAGETTPGAHDRQPYLLEPFLNQQVAYDSEFYLSIAINGYNDPTLRAVWAEPKNPQPIWNQYPQPFGIPGDFADGRPYGIPASFQGYSLDYAFFPFYPLAIRALSTPLKVVGLNPIATATLAGVIISLLGAFGAMLALYDLTRDELDNSGGIRTAFYLIAFPTGFFLAMVHTEGLFVGLAFGSLALLRRRQWVGASYPGCMRHAYSGGRRCFIHSVGNRLDGGSGSLFSEPVDRWEKRERRAREATIGFALEGCFGSQPFAGIHFVVHAFGKSIPHCGVCVFQSWSVGGGA
jgi:hypothetical protein